MKPKCLHTKWGWGSDHNAIGRDAASVERRRQQGAEAVAGELQLSTESADEENQDAHARTEEETETLDQQSPLPGFI